MERPVPSRWHWVFVIAIVVVLVSGGLAVRQYVRFSEASAAVDHTYQVLSTVDELLARHLDVETAARGYLLTAVPDLLGPYRRSAPEVSNVARRLEELVVDNPDQRVRARELAVLSRTKLEGQRLSLEEFEQGQGPQAVARVTAGTGRQDMERIRSLAADMKRTELTLLSQRETRALLARRASLLFATASLLVAVSLGFVAASVDRMFARRRLAFEHEMAARLSAERSMHSAAQELFRSERLNRSILDSSADCIQVLEPNGRLLLINDPGLRLLDIDDMEPFRGLPWPEIWGESAGVARHALDVAVVEGTARFRAFCPTTRGVPKWWDVIVTPIRDADGGVARLMCISRDITEHTRAEEERNQLLTSERAARADAERAVQLKDEFLATLSHELRTPLNAILGWVGVLKHDRAPATLDQALQVIDRNSRRQSQTIDDLLDVSRIVSGRLRLDMQRVDLAEIVEGAVASTRQAADAKGVRLITLLQSAVFVRGDADRLRQVVWNLVSNAIKFTGRNGTVKVETLAMHQHACVRVADTGEGIAPEILPLLFQRFRQADSSATRAHGGLGLGLAIVKNVVEMHGGSVEAASEGRALGATFTIRLPLWTAAAQAPGHVNGGGALLSGITALVVEDEPDALQLVRRLLEDAGARVHACGTADDALHTVGQGLVPDVIVSDVGMPEQDGYDFMRRLRQAGGAAAAAPAAALTGLARVEDRRRASNAGYQAHLAKPVDPGELIAAVATLVGRTGPGLS